MSEEKTEQETPQKAETAPKSGDDQKIMCFVSKQMVPISETVEIEYAPRKKVRVLPKYVKFDQSAN